MPKVNFIGRWSEHWQEEFKIPKGFILLKYDPTYRKNLGKAFVKLSAHQKMKLEKLMVSGELFKENDWLRELDIKIEFHYQKRNLDQNALMWALYQIEANEMNGGQKGHKDQMVHPDELYEADLFQNGEREEIITTRKNLISYIDEYRIIEEITILDINKKIPTSRPEQIRNFYKEDIPPDTKIKLKIIRGTSKLNTIEMAKWINMIFNRLAYHGIAVTNPGEIEKYWKDWRQMLNDNKVIIHDSVMTIEEYKALNPICEACSEVVIDGKGELSHIKSIGMGNDRDKELKLNYTSNWLHLCNDCHRNIWHQKGVDEFLKLFPHLTYKVKTALHREYKPLQHLNNKDDNIGGKIENIKEISREQQITKICDDYRAGKMEKEQACIALENLNYDPKVIDPGWIGIY